MSEEKKTDIAENGGNGEDRIRIEDAFTRLEAIAAALESAETTLSDSLALYAEAVRLIERCKAYLCDVEKEMIMLSGGEAE